jgi:hypothetical protein
MYVAIRNPKLTFSAPVMLSPSDIKGAKERYELALEDIKDFYPQYSPITVDSLNDIPELLSHIEALEERLRKAETALKTECPACSEAQRRFAASGVWAYTEACSKCQACSKALAELSPSKK